MTEYINKAELISVVDSWDKFGCMPDGRIAPLRELATPQEYVPYVHYDDVVKAISNMPTIDIVRCGECFYAIKRHSTPYGMVECSFHYDIDGEKELMLPNDYCADGEKMKTK